MAFPSSSLLLPLLLLLLLPLSQSQLTPDFYAKTCPEFAEIVQDTVTEKQIEASTTAAGTLRLFFHDCMVGGCDASVLITSNAFNKAERDSALQSTLPGDAFDVIVKAKTAVELKCPGVVSCADILAEATRDLITMVGGPHYKVNHGRKDSLVSRVSDVNGHLATADMTMDEMIHVFNITGFNIEEMVILAGAHTIGFSHCNQFSNRIFNFSKTSQVDPALNPKYAQALQKLCANYTKDTNMCAFNDVMTPGKFDNMYYINLQKGLGLLATDNAMAMDPRTKPFVDTYAANQTAFFEAFAKAMEKVGNFEVKTGNDGEIRRRCDTFNTLKTN